MKLSDIRRAGQLATQLADRRADLAALEATTEARVMFACSDLLSPGCAVNLDAAGAGLVKAMAKRQLEAEIEKLGAELHALGVDDLRAEWMSPESFNEARGLRAVAQ